MRRFVFPLVAFLALAGVLFIGLGLDPSKVPSPLIGRPAPAFTAPTLFEPEQSISNEDLKGRPALVNVWASWCVACRDEHPLLVEFARESDTPIYGLNYKDDRVAAVKWLNAFGNVYDKVAFDPSGMIGIDWGVYGVPETFVLDRQGVIRYKHIGALTPETMETEIMPLIKQLEAEGDA